MQRMVRELAAILGLATALTVGLLMILTGASLGALLVRTVVAGLLIFGFVQFGGYWIGRSLLQGLARRELEKEKSDQVAGESFEEEALGDSDNAKAA